MVSDVDSFNDPFEFQYIVNDEPPKLKSEQYEFLKITEQESVKFTGLTHAQQSQRMNDYNKNLSLLPEAILLDYTRERLADLIENNVNQLVSSTSTKVCCLSKECDDPLMWAHYTDGMTGFAIIYNELTTKDGKSVPALNVNYVEDIPVIDHKALNIRDLNDGIKLSTAIFASKHHRWKYENEIRLFSSTEHSYDVMNNVKLRDGGIMDLPNNAIYGVIIGFKMPKDNIQLLKDICQIHDYKLFIAKPSSKKYAVEISSLNFN
ncbi:DUF2971 domain-containing protein [Vibrio hyugaensis]|uniref:DUF2971 domain-containing protein n=1 Tax=Vibrio hyugaensis TaxID=1534743 RepID=UPI0005F042FE|nr:DUF2971 domain-containing protein [Vibrio hyugaensis]